MPETNLSANLRMLCSYGRSVSDVCRRIGINRQQFNKYLTGQTAPSLATLRRVCDFFGVDEAEILQEKKAFAKLVRLRPPVLARSDDPLSEQIEKVIRRDRRNAGLLERHAGYYNIYMSPDPSKNYLLKSIGRIFGNGHDWFSKELERYEDDEFAIPSTLKHSGLVFEAHNRIFITSREQGQGNGMWTTALIASDYEEPSFLPGLLQGIEPEGGHMLYGTRVVWEYLGKSPDLRAILQRCGAYKSDHSEVPEFVRNSIFSTEGTDTATLTAAF
ncbi:helix-turn-helix transcriptional regulator [Leisingera sp. M527]|uniref:helix-turn-helix domain-containing protein n=1 Tax=Leisingera sp. M527 TaxID=2867014 RepID=UPI0021A645A5|nr:helix-turn-helix transcriptional regulator [Leisingera sp. M527]UWQ32171.1 helix-turn-helix transcriptional regulator [Leisingera sp. M527]